MTLTLWHNPRCSKSRATLALLRDRGLQPELRLYLQTPPTIDELQTLRRRLDIPVIAFTRTAEPAFRAAGLTQVSSDAELVAAIAAQPILLERPILVADERAAIGRPPEAVLALL